MLWVAIGNRSPFVDEPTVVAMHRWNWVVWLSSKAWLRRHPFGQVVVRRGLDQLNEVRSLMDEIVPPNR